MQLNSLWLPAAPRAWKTMTRTKMVLKTLVYLPLSHLS